jgi:hypothetical protein
MAGIRLVEDFKGVPKQAVKTRLAARGKPAIQGVPAEHVEEGTAR